MLAFQSTLPQGERRQSRCNPFKQRYFNPRSHTGSDSGFSRGANCDIDFNPRSHKGSDYGSGINTQLRVISSHAPTRGATLNMCLRVTGLLFQSTLPQGERHKPLHFRRRHFPISIHAPTRGATSADIAIDGYVGISIHAPTRGATAISHKKIFLSSEIL